MTITSKIIAHSISSENIPIISVQLRYPRFIHAELMTHRVFSRNASSSRAIPVSRLIEDILADTAMPIHWGRNQKGMQAHEEHDEELKIIMDMSDDRLMDKKFIPCLSKEEAWLFARDRAIEVARAFDNSGYHKQIVNRLLEPFSHINVLVTSTEWNNFFELRRHKDAQPEIKLLADSIFESIEQSSPVLLDKGEWHLPYITPSEKSNRGLMECIRVSVARCARVSYLTHDNKVTEFEKDSDLFEKLIVQKPIHASPAEHQATPDFLWNQQSLWGNFKGWIQFRKMIEHDIKIHSD